MEQSEITWNTHKNESRKRKELFLDSKGLCFLCIKESYSERMTEVCLRNICRHLNINPSSILVKSLKESLKNEGVEEEEAEFSHEEQCDFSVLLCVTCSSLTNKLSKLIREVEVAKMLMDYQLQEFHKTILESEKQPETSGRWRKLQEEMTFSHNLDSSVVMVEARLLDNLRQETMQKCSAKIKRLHSTSLPRVQICNLETKKSKPCKEIVHEIISLEDEEIPIALPSQTELLLVTKSPAPISLPIPIDIHSVDIPKDPLEVESATDITAIKSSQLPATSASSSSKNVPSLGKHFENVHDNIYRCGVCKNMIKVQAKCEMIEHLANIHPETIFAHKKLRNVPEELFKLICCDVLSSNSKLLKTGPNSNYRNELLCSICHKCCRNSRTLRSHLVMNHYNILQENITLRQLRSVPISKGAVRREVTFCSKTTDSVPAVHSEVVSMNKFSSFVNNVEIVDIGEGKDNDHPEPTKAILTMPGQVQITIASTNIDSCKDDDETYAESDSSDSSSHSITLSKDDSDWTPNQNQIKNRKSSANQKDQVLSNTAPPVKTNAARDYECRVCGEDINESVYFQHMVNSHPEKVFACGRLPNIPESQFLNFCREILRTETTEAVGRMTISSDILPVQTQFIFCAYCGHKCKSDNDLRYHLALEHFAVLKEKLIRLQRGISYTQTTSDSGQQKQSRQAARKRTSGSRFDGGQDRQETEPASKRSSTNDTVQTTRSGRKIKKSSAFPFEIATSSDFIDGNVSIVCMREDIEETTEKFPVEEIVTVQVDENVHHSSSVDAVIYPESCELNERVQEESHVISSSCVKMEAEDVPVENQASSDDMFESKINVYFKVSKTENDLSDFC